MAFNLVNVKLLFLKIGEKKLICDIIVAIIVVWRSYIAYSCCQIHLRCFVSIHFCCDLCPYLGEIVLAHSLLM